MQNSATLILTNTNITCFQYWSITVQLRELQDNLPIHVMWQSHWFYYNYMLQPNVHCVHAVMAYGGEEYSSMHS